MDQKTTKSNKKETDRNKIICYGHFVSYVSFLVDEL